MLVPAPEEPTTDMMGCFVDINSEEFGKLGACDYDGCCVCKAVDNRVRKKIHNQPQAQNAKKELEYPNSQGKDYGIGYELGRARCRQWFE